MIQGMARWPLRLQAGLFDFWARGLSYAPTIRGRATRTELLVTIIVVSLAFAPLIKLADRLTGAIGNMLQVALIVLLVLPYASAVIRRLHDTGRSAWDLWVCVVPWIGAGYITIVLLWNGQKGPNEYGPEPRRGR